MLTTGISFHVSVLLYSLILSLKTFSPWFMQPLSSSPLLIKCPCRSSRSSFSPLISTRKGKRLKILSKASLMAHEVVLLETSRAAHGWELQSLIKTSGKARQSWNPSLQPKQIQTANCRLVGYRASSSLRQLCWSNCPYAYTQRVWGSAAYSELLSPGESWVPVCWVPLVCFFLTERLASQKRIHTSLLAQCTPPYGQAFLTVCKKLPQTSWWAHPFPLKYCGEEKPSPR